MKKNFRTLLLKEASSFQAYLSNINSHKNLKKLEPYTLLEFSKGKENSYDSKPISIKDFKKFSQVKNSKYFLYKNFLELNEISKNLPILKEKQSISISTSYINKQKHIPNHINNSVNDFLLSRKFRIKLSKKENNNNNNINTINKKNNLLLNSIEKNSNDHPKYIFLNKIFKIKQSESKKDCLTINYDYLLSNISKSKNKKYKLKNDKDYKDYINKRVKLSYNNNFNSSYVHKIKTDYMIHRLKKKYPMKLDSEKEYQYSDEDEEMVQEKRDFVDGGILGDDKIFRKIKNVLFNQNKRQFIGQETKNFFKKKENKYNFLYDINLLPNFKNNLLRKEGCTFQQKLEGENFIEYKTWRFLNKAKIRLQKIKDDENFSEFVLYEDDLKTNKESKDEDRFMVIRERKISKTYKEKYESFEVEDYLSKKKQNQSIVNIIDDKTKKFFYGTFIKIHNNNNNK